MEVSVTVMLPLWVGVKVTHMFPSSPVTPLNEVSDSEMELNGWSSTFAVSME